MRGQDLINIMLPDEALMEVLKYVDGRGSDRDACALVCRRWRTLESASRHSLTLGATGQSDSCLARMLQKFTNLRQVCVDERLPVPMPIDRRLPHRQALLRPFLVSSHPCWSHLGQASDACALWHVQTFWKCKRVVTTL